MSGPLTITLAQLSGSIFGRTYLPYAAGLLESYTRAHAPDPTRYRFGLPLFKRGDPDALTAPLVGQDVVAFSVYMWNRALSLEVARRLKALSPGTLIVMGGPEIPGRSEAFLRDHPQVDVCGHGEGEAVFLALLEALPTPSPRLGGMPNLQGVPGISYLDLEGSYRKSPLPSRISDLSAIPSPYLSGVFDPLIAANPDQGWLACWETNRGCPFRCTFCDWGQATGAKVFRFPEDRVKGEITWCADRQVEFVFCCDANFGILPRDLDLARFVADERARTGFPKEMSIQNTKNATERAYEVHRILHAAGLNREVVLSLQSVDAPTLTAIRRKNISLETFAELQRRFLADGVPTYTDVLIGLPGETLQAFVEGIGSMISGGQRNRIKFYTLTALPNAELSEPAYVEAHGVELAEVPLVNLHSGAVDRQDGVEERHWIVIATAAMPRPDWVRARSVAWMVEMLYFSGLIKAPMDALAHRLGVPYHEALFALAEAPAGPNLERIRAFFQAKGEAIQGGDHEHCPPAPWTHGWSAVPDYTRCSLVESGRMGPFLKECAEVLAALAQARRGPEGRGLIAATAALSDLLGA